MQNWSNMKLHNVLIDTDVSVGLRGGEIDDAAAIIALVRDPKVRVGHITTVFGNAAVDSTTFFARDLLKRLGSTAVVTSGAEGPLAGRPFTPPWEPHKLLSVRDPSDDAAQVIVNQAQTNGPLTIVALGPLTNLALAIRAAPDIIKTKTSVYVMGGNLGPTGEFNFDADPEAVDIVLQSGLPVTLFGLEVTNQATFTPEWFETLDSDPALDMLKFAAPEWIKVVSERGWHDGGCALHDAVPAIFLSHPEIADVVQADRSMLQARGVQAKPGRLRVAKRLHSELFIRRLAKAFQSPGS